MSIKRRESFRDVVKNFSILVGVNYFGDGQETEICRRNCRYYYIFIWRDDDRQINLNLHSVK